MGKSIRERKRDAKKNFMALLVIIGFGVVVFSINSVGKFIAQKVISPVVSLTATKKNAVTDKITAEPIEFYLLSFGEFDTEAEAEEKGNVENSGGYVLKNDGKFTGICDCFINKEQAEKQKNSKGNIQIITVKTASVSLKVTGTSDQISLINSVFSALNNTAEELIRVNEEYALGTSSKLQTLSKLQKYKDKIIGICSDAESLKTDNSTVKAICEMCACGKTILSELPKSNDEDFSKKVKYICTSFACEYMTFCNELG